MQNTTRTRDQWMVLIAAFLGWMFDGLEQGIFPLVARPALQDLLGVDGGRPDSGRWMGYITALFLLGAAWAGSCSAGWATGSGRVRAMIVEHPRLFAVHRAAAILRRRPWQLGLFRFLAAIGMGGEWSLGVALVMECWPEKHRPLLAGAIGAAANVGFGLLGSPGDDVPCDARIRGAG